MKVHSQTLMAMKSGCKIYTQKCYVNIGCVAHNLCKVPSENNSACEVPLKCNFANKRSLFEDFFPQAVPCPFSILGRTLSTAIASLAVSL